MDADPGRENGLTRCRRPVGPAYDGPGEPVGFIALPEPSQSTEIYSVDDLRIDAGRRLINRGEAVIPVPKLSFDLLLVLIRAAPNVVSIDEFMEQVWPGLVVSPETVSQRVKLLRGAIGDDPREPKYIAGVRGLGYRLIARVEREGVSRPPDPIAPEVDRPPSGSSSETGAVQAQLPSAIIRHRLSQRPALKMLLALGTIAIVAIGAVVLLHEYRRIPNRQAFEGTATRTVAVLPFDNLSATHENDYIAVGLSEMVLNRLSAVPSLQVVARTSSFALQGTDLQVSEIGRKLKADYLVRGSVQRSGDALRLTAQLIDVTSGRQIKALHLDKSLKDIFSIEDEIADSVAAALALRMGDARFHLEQARNVSLSAYLEYLQGRASLGHFKMADMERAAAHFKRAIELDPSFAAAYSSLADAQRWIKLGRWELDPDAEDELETLVNKAISLDSGLGEAYVERAVLERDATRAEADFRKGLDLSPSYGLGYTYLAENLLNLNRREEAQRVLDHAIRIDPLSARAPYIKATLKMNSAITLAAAREAEALLTNVLAVDPEFTNALVRIAQIKAVIYGQLAEAMRFIERARRADPGAEWIIENAISIYAAMDEAAAMRNLAAAAGDHLWYGREWVASYDGDWRAAVQLEFDRPARLDYVDEDLPPILAVQIHAHRTREFDRCVAHLRKRFHLQEGRELDDSQLDPVLAIAQILKDKGDIEAARRIGTSVLKLLDLKETSSPSREISYNIYRSKAHLVMGERNTALQDFENAAAVGSYFYLWSIDDDNMWDPIRGDPKFQALVSRQKTYVRGQRELLEEMRSKGEIPAHESPAHLQDN